MFNSGVRGARARDSQGTISPQSQFAQNTSPQASITGYSVLDSDDLTLDPAGGQTVVVRGGGFAVGVSVVLDGVTIGSVTRVSDTEIRFTSPAKAGGSYTLIAYNTTGGGGILVPGLVYSAVPAWTTSAGSIGSNYETTTINRQVVATSDSALTYTLASGSLPAGATLNSNGTITGTAPVDGSSTTYTFAVTATDAELQDTTRTFTLTINTDVVSWTTPAPSATVNLDAVAADITLAATSAAGYSISNYSADTLPDGLTLSDGKITGTPLIAGTFNTTLSATAATSARTGTNTVTWIITLGDLYFGNTVLLVPGDVRPALSDASTNNLQVSTQGGVLSKQSPFSNPDGGSVTFTSYNQWVHIPAGSTAFQYGTGDYTVECWLKFPGVRTQGSAIFDYSEPGYSEPYMAFSSGTLQYRIGGSWAYIAPVSVFYTDASSYKDGGWHHFALTRSSGSAKVFIDGTQFGSTFTDNYNYTRTTSLRIFGINTGAASDAMYGYCSNFRVVKGTALYTTNFTPPTQALTAVPGTTLLTLQTAIPTNNNAIVDSSPYFRGITRNGNTTQGSFSPFGENWSYYFDGTTDVVTPPANDAFALGTGAFCIEGWVFNTTLKNYSCLVTTRPNNGSYADAYHVGWGADGGGSFYVNTTGYAGWPAGTLKTNKWQHLVVSRNSSGVVSSFVDGVRVGTSTGVTTNFTRNLLGIGDMPTTQAEGIIGNISNLRIVKGSSVYDPTQTTITVPTGPLTAVSGTVLLTAQNNRFVDNSAYKHTLTRTGDVRVQEFNPFSRTSSTLSNTSHSVRFNGNGLLDINYNSALDLSTGDFTLEMWIYPYAIDGMALVFAGGNMIAWASYELSMGSGGIYFAASSSNNGYNIGSESGTTGRMGDLTVGAWNHVAVTRSGDIYRGFVNGVQGYTQTTSLRPYNPNARGLIIGSNYNTTWGGSSLTSATNSHISNVRLVKGTALYTTNFTPPTSPLTAVSGTTLLTCQNNTIKDNSTNNFDVRIPSAFFGKVYPTTLSPFSSDVPTYSLKEDHTSAKFGGSLYFDGTGDYLNVGGMDVGTGDFTLQGWVYPTAWVEWQSVFSTRATNAASAVQWCLGIHQTGYPYVYSDNFQVQGSAGQVGLNVWTHLCVTKKSNAMRLFVNGNQVALNPSTSQNYTTAAAGIGANNNGSEPLTGFVSQLELLKGTGLYTSSFVPPRQPTTPGTSSQHLLLLGTNGAVRDASSNNLLETLGDTKISTSVGKFSRTYSMQFDGTGDYLKILSNANSLALGTSDFTIEMWINRNSSGVVQHLLDFRGANNNDYNPVFYWQTNNYLYYTNNNTSGDNQIQNSNPITSSSGWVHLALVRSGTTLVVYVNGVASGSVTYSTDIRGGNTVFVGSRFTGTGDFNGYIQDLRITKGIARYTTNFSTPLASVPQK